MGMSRKALQSPVHGAVIGIEVVVGQVVAAGQTLLLLEAMKMEVPLEAPVAGSVRAIAAAVGDVVAEGQSAGRTRAGRGAAARRAGRAAARPARAARRPAACCSSAANG